MWNRTAVRSAREVVIDWGNWLKLREDTGPSLKLRTTRSGSELVECQERGQIMLLDVVSSSSNWCGMVLSPRSLFGTYKINRHFPIDRTNRKLKDVFVIEHRGALAPMEFAFIDNEIAERMVVRNRSARRDNWTGKSPNMNWTAGTVVGKCNTPATVAPADVFDPRHLGQQHESSAGRGGPLPPRAVFQRPQSR